VGGDIFRVFSKRFAVFRYRHQKTWYLESHFRNLVFWRPKMKIYKWWVVGNWVLLFCCINCAKYYTSWKNRENGGIKSFKKISTDNFCYKFGDCFFELQRYRENYSKFQDNSRFEFWVLHYTCQRESPWLHGDLGFIFWRINCAGCLKIQFWISFWCWALMSLSV